MKQLFFSRKEFKNTINKCNNSSTLGLDCVLWKHLKNVIKDDKCLLNIVNIANTCINMGYQPSHFKTSSSIIIPKPNKMAYDSLKMFYSTVLLNTLGKLIKKVICKRLQYQSVSTNFIYPNQLDGLKQCLTIDMDIFLIHFIHSEQVKSLQMSILAFDIAQFFLLLNYQLLSFILNKAGFDSKIFCFFANYLISRKAQYL